MTRVFLAGGKRTAIGKFMGSLSPYSAVELGSHVIKAVIQETRINVNEISEIIIGNAISVGLGQNPARQMAIKAGIGVKVPALNINKVCASGLKAICLAATSIKAGEADNIIVGGTESLSNVPHYTNLRSGTRYGDSMLIDALINDGLTDSPSKFAMGTCAEKTAEDMKITREMQDEYCIASYEKAIEAQNRKYFEWEISPMNISENKCFRLDEELGRFDKGRISTLKTVFSPFYVNGCRTITSANSSKLSDGACAFLVFSESKIKESDLSPLAEIIAFADAETDSTDFSISPSLAIKKVLLKAKMAIEDIDFWEINEAFSSTVLANVKILGIDSKKVNIFGGSVALGHPLGMSGSRIVLSLINVLRITKGRYGIASICNGGGGATAILIKSCFAE